MTAELIAAEVVELSDSTDEVGGDTVVQLSVELSRYGSYA